MVWQQRISKNRRRRSLRKRSESASGTASGEDVSATGEKKKVRVVVKRKAKAKTAPKESRETPEERTSASESPTTKKSSVEKPAAETSSKGTESSTARNEQKRSAHRKPQTASQDETGPSSPEPKQDKRQPAGEGKAHATAGESADQSSKDTKSADTPSAPASKPETAKEPAKPGLAWSNAKPTGKGSCSHSRRPSAAAYHHRCVRARRKVSLRREKNGPPTSGVPTGPADLRPPGKAARVVRHNAVPVQGVPRRTRPAPGAQRGPGKGRPPQGGGAPPGGGTTESTDKRGGTPAKGPGKRFYKSKKGRGGGAYERDERQREKEISFNRKKPQPKANPVPKEIDIMEVVTVSELARKMNLKANELIGKLMGMGMMVTINQQIDRETAEILAGEYGCKVNVVSLYDETLIETEKDEASDLRDRSPIVTVMGHVDHGKTKLLDAIRSTNLVDDEHGGITQHIGAYQVDLHQGVLTFLDTPGHEAFTLMRARGAQVTDIVILVVAANDGVMPQTREAISHAKDAGVPIVVAINKVDLPEVNVDRVKQQLSELELIPDEWGGQTPMVEVSALQREGIEDLLETVLLQAELLELKANYDRNAEGKGN